MIDYEAAANEMNESGWTCDGHEPRKRGGPEACTPCAALHTAHARRIVNAALGDEPLYRVPEHAVVKDFGGGELRVDGNVHQMWPGEVSDDN